MPVLGTELYAGEFNLTIGGSAIVAAGLQRLSAQVGLIAELGSVCRLKGIYSGKQPFARL